MTCHPLHSSPPSSIKMLIRTSCYRSFRCMMDWRTLLNTMHFHQVMTLQSGNDTLLCKEFLYSLFESAMSWFHRLPPNIVTSFHALLEKFVTQYMCSIRRKQSVPSMFHARMGQFKSIREFMKRFGVAIL